MRGAVILFGDGPEEVGRQRGPHGETVTSPPTRPAAARAGRAPQNFLAATRLSGCMLETVYKRDTCCAPAIDITGGQILWKVYAVRGKAKSM